MSSPRNEHDDAYLSSALSRFKKLPEDAQLQQIKAASDEVGDEVVINKIKKLPKESEEEFRIRKFTELLKNLPKDSQQKFNSAFNSASGTSFDVARLHRRFFNSITLDLKGDGAGTIGAGGTPGVGAGTSGAGGTPGVGAGTIGARGTPGVGAGTSGAGGSTPGDGEGKK